uniref:Uncharacterized protein n=1 Tax=Panagrolaimus sp. ES5 TaxID=591445 RepID=A0AC34GSA9_9BILA
MGVCMSRRVVEVRVADILPPVIIPKDTPQLKKRDSDMNMLVPGEVIVYDSDESRFEREKIMLVICTNVNISKNSKVMLIDVDYQSKNYGTVISELSLPTDNDELMNAGWMRSAAKTTDISVLNRTQLIVPCFSSSRIYTIAVENQSSLRVSNCIESDQLLDKNVKNPFSVCSYPSRVGPSVISTLCDRRNRVKGDIISFNVEKGKLLRSDEHRHAVFGGFLAIQAKQKIAITTEFGDPLQLLTAFLNQENDTECLQENAYGHCLNVWDIEKTKFRQTIRLDEDAIGLNCIRFLHHPECNHAFACSVFGGSIYHIHKKSTTEEYLADKVVQYPKAFVEGWLKPEMPPMPLDLIISMDDRFLFVSCFLHGFIEQFNISDPFRVSSCTKIFLGGAIQRSIGIKLQRINAVNFTPKRRFLRNQEFDAGPARMQLSLDGRRLYVTNSYYTPWDLMLFPTLKERGSCIALIHVTVKSSGGMVLDENFAIRFTSENFENGPYLAREMKFMNGDSTSDSCLE